MKKILLSALFLLSFSIGLSQEDSYKDNLIEYMKSQNLIKGGSLDDAIVIKDHKPLNKEGLRFENELMRHKVLDVVGDLYLSGYPIIGTYRGFKTGHFITNNLLIELFKSEDNFSIHQIN